MANKVTIHFRDERADRATYIAQTVGFGEVIRTAEIYRESGLIEIRQITETGVQISRGLDGRLITMFIMQKHQIIGTYKKCGWGYPPRWLLAKAEKNWKKGYTQNQPDYH